MVEAPCAIPDFTPVNLVTGFLGSGKTTLLGRMLRSATLADTAVLINEFGEVGLDHELIERVDDNMVLLQSGCLCCTIRGEFADAIGNLDERRASGAIPANRRIVIQSTGLADPLPILTTITADLVLRHHYRLGLVITTVDAVNGMSQLDRVRPMAIPDASSSRRFDPARQRPAEPRGGGRPSGHSWRAATRACPGPPGGLAVLGPPHAYSFHLQGPRRSQD